MRPVEAIKLLNILRGLSVEQLTLFYLSQQTVILDKLLWPWLPDCLRTPSLSGFIASQMVAALIRPYKDKNIVGINSYLEKIAVIQEKVVTYLPLHWGNIRLEYWLDQLFVCGYELSEQFNREQYDLEKASLMAEKTNSGAAINQIMPKQNTIPGLTFVYIPKDGHCLYNAVALYLGQDVTTLRQVVAANLEHNIEKYREFIVLPEGKTIEEYIEATRNSNEWAGELEIRILIELLNRPIIIIGQHGKIINQAMLKVTEQEPIFVYYDGINHYQGFILKEGFTGKNVLAMLQQETCQKMESLSSSIKEETRKIKSLSLVDTMALLEPQSLPTEIIHLLQCLEEIIKLYATLKDTKALSQNDQVIEALIATGDFWGKIKGREIKSPGLPIATKETLAAITIPLMHSLMFYQTTLKFAAVEKVTLAEDSLSEVNRKILDMESMIWKVLTNKSIAKGALQATNTENLVKLEQLRSKFNEKLSPIFAQPYQLERSAAEADVEKARILHLLQQEFCTEIKTFFGELMQQIMPILGAPPCTYAVIGFGSLAKQTFTPYSDLEFAILLANDTELNRQYFRKLTYLLHTKIINLRETAVPLQGIKYTFDYLKGLCFDSSGKTPLGFYEYAPAMNYGELKYELIGDITAILRYLEDATFKLDRHLPIEVTACTHICGDPGLTKSHQSTLEQKLSEVGENGQTFYQQRALQILQGDSEFKDSNLQAFTPQIFGLEQSGKIYDVKQEIYRVPDRLIDCLAFYYGITAGSNWEKIGELVKRRIIDEHAGHNLQIMDAIATEIRLKAYQYYRGQRKTMVVVGFSGAEFYLNENRNLLERFYYTTLPFCAKLTLWLNAVLNANEAFLFNDCFFNNDPQIKTIVYMRLFDYQQAAKSSKEIYENSPKNTSNLNILGFLLEQQGNARQALAYRQQALEICQKLYVEKHPNVASSFDNIGITFRMLGDAKKALDYFQKALAIKQELYREKHPTIADSFNNIGSTFIAFGDAKQALDYFQKALAIQQELYGTKHPDLADSLNNIGAAFHSLGDTEQALVYYQKSLWACQELYGAKHPVMALRFNNIGSAFHKLGDVRQALDYHQKALAIQQELYNIKHPAIAYSFNKVGGDFHALGNTKQALDYFQKALAIQQELYGTKHPDVADSFNDIGSTFIAFGEAEQALDYFQKALAIQQELYGAKHPGVAGGFNNIGVVFRNLGKAKQAFIYFQKALAIQQELYSDKHPNVADSFNNLGGIFCELRDVGQALIYHQKALAIQRKLYNEKHPSVAASLNNIGVTFHLLRDVRQAFIYFQKALVIRQELYSDKHPDVASSLNNMGIAFSALGNDEQALVYYQRALVIRQELYSDKHPDVASSLNNIGMVFKDLGKTKLALEYLQKALAIWQKFYNPMHPNVIACFNDIRKIYQSLGIIIELSSISLTLRYDSFVEGALGCIPPLGSFMDIENKKTIVPQKSNPVDNSLYFFRMKY